MVLIHPTLITVELWRVGLDDPSISFLVGNDAGQEPPLSECLEISLFTEPM